jgi:hypothetical protein
VLARSGVEQGGVDACLDVSRQQRLEDRARVGLELEVGGGSSGSGIELAVAARHGRRAERHEWTQHDLLAACADEAGVDELHAVDLTGREQLDDVAADRGRVGSRPERR